VWQVTSEYSHTSRSCKTLRVALHQDCCVREGVTYIHGVDPYWTTQDSDDVVRSCWRCRPWLLTWHRMGMRH